MLIFAAEGDNDTPVGWTTGPVVGFAESIM